MADSFGLLGDHDVSSGHHSIPLRTLVLVRSRGSMVGRARNEKGIVLRATMITYITSASN